MQKVPPQRTQREECRYLPWRAHNERFRLSISLSLFLVSHNFDMPPLLHGFARRFARRQRPDAVVAIAYALHMVYAPKSTWLLFVRWACARAIQRFFRIVLPRRWSKSRFRRTMHAGSGPCMQLQLQRGASAHICTGTREKHFGPGGPARVDEMNCALH